MTPLDRITAEELTQLQAECGAGLSPALLKQTRVMLRHLVIAPLVFQPRSIEESEQEIAKHVAILAASVREAGQLDPILILAVDGQRIIVDGHCRHAAYLEAGTSQGALIPVRYVKQGKSVWDAQAEAAKINSKDRLSWTPAAKQESAWRLVKSAPASCSVRAIALLTNTPKSTVHRMRQALDEEDSRRAMSWAEVRNDVRQSVEVDERWEERVIAKLMSDMAKALGPVPTKQPDLFAEAIHRQYPRAYRTIEDRVQTELREELGFNGTPDF